MPLFIYFWMAMFAAAMMPATSYAAPRTPSPEPKAIVQVDGSAPARATRRRATPKAAPIAPVRELMTLGWVSEDDAPIF